MTAKPERQYARGATGLPVLECYTGKPSQAITTSAVMTAGEMEWEVGCLHPLSRRSSLLLRGRVSSGWWRYADLSKYRSTDEEPGTRAITLTIRS